MRNFGLLCLLLTAAVCQSACTPKAAQDSQSVVGPDLGRDGPFNAAHEITLIDTKPDESVSVSTVAIEEPASSKTQASQTASSEELPDIRKRIDIVRGPTEDVATLTNVMSYSQTYLAGVTYQRFLPIVAETNAEARDYWIVAMNMTRTPDRSAYTILRYPHGLAIKPGLVSDDFEYLKLDCFDLDLASQSHYDIETTDKAGKTKTRKIRLEAAKPPETGSCEFNSRTEALRLTPAIFKNYDKLKKEENAPHLSWQPLHVEVR